MENKLYDIKINSPGFVQEGCMKSRSTVIPALHKGVHYKIFKKETGFTPGEYRKLSHLRY